MGRRSYPEKATVRTGFANSFTRPRTWKAIEEIWKAAQLEE